MEIELVGFSSGEKDLENALTLDGTIKSMYAQLGKPLLIALNPTVPTNMRITPQTSGHFSLLV
jgi:hypothetical protein